MTPPDLLSDEQEPQTQRCGCGMEPSPHFPSEPVRGDWCPIGMLNLHHWHGDVCVFCSGLRRG